MTAPNVNTLWGRALVDELAKAGVETVVAAPGSRSTPLTVAAARNDDLEVVSLLDERSAAFFALGRAKRTGQPTPLICTSGTAAAEFHPAVIEADRSRTPMLLLTADRPPELADSGANQTVDQSRLYGDAVRYHRTLPEPAAADRTLRSLRTTVCRAVGESVGAAAGPVHLNVPFAKPLEPTAVPGSVPDTFAAEHPLAANGRDGPFVAVHPGQPTAAPGTVSAISDAVDAAERGLIVAGPSGPEGLSGSAGAELAEATGFPVLADPLSGLRFGPHVSEMTVCGGYDAYLDTPASEPLDPDLVLRFGASPTSKPLRQFLSSSAARQVVVDPAGGWREASFTAGELVESDPTAFAEALVGELDGPPADPDWRARFEAAEAAHWELLEEASDLFEGAVAARVAAGAPDPATLYASSSMPVRDLDRFGAPDAAELTVLGSRGASGIDGITSAAVGAGSAVDEPLVLLIGDLAFYHDLTGLLALERAGVDATIVLVNNDGGGIFHQLPIAAFDPPFTALFETPHGLDFGHAADLFGLEHSRVETLDGFEAAYADSLAVEGSQLVEVRTDAEASFAVRDRLQDALVERLT
ncbi:MAG: 2-succinyl-5-enolpyruvyl-6-hydroxy-3-cyclohexene-1-carboxylic-acid synthase [Halobacteriales archaeon]|nr:2-succinyl-5-enolpyruvyl-6-hydroxy-3-cyclohexene-1-carboxylic-acid synthase [Halobacteriales archaeon]